MGVGRSIGAAKSFVLRLFYDADGHFKETLLNLRPEKWGLAANGMACDPVAVQQPVI